MEREQERFASAHPRSRELHARALGGALLSGVDADGVEAAARYGWNVGMAFQLSDDILDIASDHEDSGKTPGTDLKEGVRTLPVLYALESDDGELAGLLDGVPDDAQVARALELLRGSDALDRARVAAGTYVDAATAELARFGDRPIVTALSRLAAYALDRAG